MWKTPGRFWAQISPFAHILPPKTAEIHCSAMEMALFSKPEVVSGGFAWRLIGAGFAELEGLPNAGTRAFIGLAAVDEGEIGVLLAFGHTIENGVAENESLA